MLELSFFSVGALAFPFTVVGLSSVLASILGGSTFGWVALVSVPLGSTTMFLGFIAAVTGAVAPC